MSLWVGLLHSVILGPERRLRSADLLEAAAIAGWTRARTVIASGNLIFEADGSEAALAETLSAAMGRASGRAVAATCRTANEWRALVADNPFPKADSAQVCVRVMTVDPDPAAYAAALVRRGPDEAVVLGARLIWLHAPEGFSASPLARALSTPKIGPGTWRNASAVAKIAAALD